MKCFFDDGDHAKVVPDAGLWHCEDCKIVICNDCGTKTIKKAVTSKHFIITCPVFADQIINKTLEFNQKMNRNFKGVIIQTDEEYVKKFKKMYKDRELCLGVASDAIEITKMIKKLLEKN
jgi:hypothetical protein